MSSYETLRSRNTVSQIDQYIDDVEEAESVEELRQKLRQMKALVNERPNKKSGVDDGFLSIVFGLILFVIGFVTLYAFYNLYAAVHRRWYPPHEL